MSEQSDPLRFDPLSAEVPSTHLMRSQTLESMRKRLAILRDERLRSDFFPPHDVDETTSAYLETLRHAFEKIRLENTRLAMLSLLKKLEKELVQRGLNPENEIDWVLKQLAEETPSPS